VMLWFTWDNCAYTCPAPPFPHHDATPGTLTYQPVMPSAPFHRVVPLGALAAMSASMQLKTQETQSHDNMRVETCEKA